MASNLKGLDAALARVRLPVNSLREEVLSLCLSQFFSENCGKV
jgi:hypothetical protein